MSTADVSDVIRYLCGKVEGRRGHHEDLAGAPYLVPEIVEWIQTVRLQHLIAIQRLVVGD